jgi:tryptophan-rich sensory protein
MAVAAWLVWRKRSPGSRPALALFAIQLLLNIAWSGAFFGLRQIGLSVLVIAALWLLIAATARAFWPRSRPAALLLIPYLAWVSFAAALNFAIFRANS